MAKEAIAAEGVSPDQDNKTIGVGGVSTCTGVTTGTTVGTTGKTMVAMNAKEIVTAEKRSAQLPSKKLLPGVHRLSRLGTAVLPNKLEPIRTLLGDNHATFHDR